MQEYEERLAQLQASYQAEQASRARLEKDISSLRDDFDLKVSVLEDLVRKEAGVEEAGGGCAAKPRFPQEQGLFLQSDLWQPLHPLKGSGCYCSKCCLAAAVPAANPPLSTAGAGTLPFLDQI